MSVVVLKGRGRMSRAEDTCSSRSKHNIVHLVHVGMYVDCTLGTVHIFNVILER